ncbi:MAG: hypothetical protein RIR49_813 [Actinomycetota bacterium]
MDSDLILDSLRRRMRAMHSLYRDAAASMDLEHVNAPLDHGGPRPGLPIAFSWFHIVNMIDASFMLLTGAAPIWDASWAERVGLGIDDHGKHRTHDEMLDQQIADLGAMIEYQEAVFTRTEAWLEALDPAELSRVVVAHPLPPMIASTFSARVAGDAGITVLDGVECWIYQHAMRHMGEIEYVRGALGLAGMTS